MELKIHQDRQATGSIQSLAAIGQWILLVCFYVLSFKAGFAYISSHTPALWIKTPWLYGYLSHAWLLLVALGFMAILKPFRGRNFGLLPPRPAQSCALHAVSIGACFGLLMLVVDYYPSLIHRSAPQGPYATNPGNVIPWLLMEGVVVGFTEEAVFRGLFLGYLLSRISYRVRFGKYQVSAAGILIAVVFSLAHAQAFWHVSLISALGQQIYAIAIGIFCAYLFENSGSLLAPALAHNAGDFVEWSCCFIMTALWHR